MGTALIYLVVVLGVAAAFFFGACAVFGRGEELAPPPDGTSPTWLPDPGRDVTAADVRALRFQQTVRGYKMAEVDWALDRLADELDRHRAALAQAQVELDHAYGVLDQTRAELDQTRAQRLDQPPAAAEPGSAPHALEPADADLPPHPRTEAGRSAGGAG